LPTNIRSPFDTTIWKSRLRDLHFDSCFIDTLIHDIEHGVNIGYTGRRTCLISPNHHSAVFNREAVARELERELGLDRKIGPFLDPPCEHFVGSPMGAIPKKRSTPIKWRIINDLSWPEGQSINDGISKDSFSYGVRSPPKFMFYILSYTFKFQHQRLKFMLNIWYFQYNFPILNRMLI